MSHNKKRGLQHKLSDILKPVTSLEEKTKYTSQLLSRIAPKEKPTSDQQSPVDQQPLENLETSIGQQSPVSNSHQYHINASSESPLTIESPSRKTIETPDTNEASINNYFQSQQHYKTTGDYQSPVDQQPLVPHSHQYQVDSLSEKPLTVEFSSKESLDTSFHDNEDFINKPLQQNQKNTGVQQSLVDQRTLVPNSHQHSNEIYTQNSLTNTSQLTKTLQYSLSSTNSNNTSTITKNFLQREHQNTGDQQTLVTESPVDQQTPVPNSHQYNEPERNFIKVPNAIFDKLMSLLDPYEFKVYLRLFRLSHGFHKTQCLVGYNSLAQACDLSIRHIKRVIPELEIKGLLKIITTYNTANIKGTLYEVFADNQQTPVTGRHQRPTATSVYQSPNKLDDDDFKKTDHHLSQQSEHEKQVMMMYQNITQNSWTKADIATYQKIKHITLDKVETAIRLASQRASSRPNSLAFFTKEILSVASPKQNRSKQKKLMEKIVDRVRNSFIGSNYSMADFVHKVKDLCLRDDIAFDNDLLDEILSRNNK